MLARGFAGSLVFVVALAVCNAPGEPRENTLSTPPGPSNEVALPNLVPIYWQVPQKLSGPPWPWVDVVFGITNNGPGAAAGAWIDGIYPDDNRSRFVVAGPKTELPAGGVYWRTNRIQIPLTNSGTYKLVLDANVTRQLAEDSVQDNTVTNVLEFTAMMSDLVPVGFTAPHVLTLPEDDSVLVSWGTRNAGIGPAAGHPQWLDKIYLSKDGVLSADDVEVFSLSILDPIMPGTAAWRSGKLNLRGQQPGAYYLILNVNARNVLVESATNNNVLARPCFIQEQKPDLTAIRFIAPGLITNGTETIVLEYTVTNQGSGGVPRYAVWQDTLYFTSELQYRDYYRKLGEAHFTGPMSPGASYSVTITNEFNAHKSGHFVVIIGDEGDDLRETTNRNNIVAIPVGFSPSRSDLAFSFVEHPVFVDENTIEVTWGIINLGPGPTDSFWGVYAPLELTKVGSSDTAFAWNYSPPLGPGETVVFTNRFSSVYGPGMYQLKFEIDPHEYENDPSRLYNSTTLPFEVGSPAPDLAIVAVQMETNLVYSPYQPIQIAYQVTNMGTVRITGWELEQTLLDETTQKSVGWLPRPSHTNVVTPGSSLWVTNIIRMAGPSGSLSLRLEASLPRDADSNLTNNRFLTPLNLEYRLPDLAVIAWITATNPPGSKPPALEYAWKVSNLGPGDFYPTAAYPYDGLAITLQTLTNGVPGRGVWTNSFKSVIPAGSSIEGTNRLEFIDERDGPESWRLAAISGTPESSTNNNFATIAWEEDYRADLALTYFMAPDRISGAQRQEVTIILGVTNAGRGTLRPGWYYGMSLDYLQSGVQSDFRLLNPITVDRSLAPGENLWFTNTLALPLMDSGTYRLRPYAYGTAAEDVSWSNNRVEAPLDVELSRPSQLRPEDLKVSAYRDGARVIVDSWWSVINEGDGAAEPAWLDGLFYSDDDTWSWDDVNLGRFTNSAVLVPGAGYSGALTTTQPGNIQQPGYIVFCVDLANELADADVWNNSRAVLLRILPAAPGPVGLTAPRLGPDGVFRARAYGNAGSRALYQVSTDLVNWTTQQILTFEGSTLEVEDRAATNNPARFYRMVEE